MVTAIPDGIVFVSYVRLDRSRVGPLVTQLKSRFNVFWDGDLEYGDPWQSVLEGHLYKARCVLLMLTKQLTSKSFVTNEVEIAKKRGTLFPVKLDSDAEIPVAFNQWHYLDLSEWSGVDGDGLEPLFVTIRKRLSGPAPNPQSTALTEGGSWRLLRSSNAVDQMAELVERVSTLGGVLMNDAGPVNDIAATLAEIHATYNATAEAIDRFLEPGATKRSRIKSYRHLAGRLLTELVDDKRGHCSRILELYGRAGGLREWLKARANRKLIGETDIAFIQLSNADTDLFADLTDIAETLRDEAADISHLLSGGQVEVAEERISNAREVLLPLQRKLTTAMSSLQQVEGRMGFVPSQKRETK